ncbi:ABC-2 type transport system ATP-binding protein [Croceifilum oryzae]|uniref:ABC-2 type transport system ATP-binding protein n=1 Tax=Croceifilum oryzae TaxID=1553429 RepID=A0AAJ1WTA2_9BACL|nr:ABC transporter ATP-binding protein [Croceifilum oryzae]MDQ0418585.1 ABC-2 type transport system ATP-binding protein [Croceifilum oryzae]
MLHIEQLSKKYKNNIWAVQDFNLSIYKEELVAMVGPNGAGKTSIINCLLGVISPTSGTIQLDTYPNQSKKFKQLIAYVPDDLILPEALTGTEYLDFVTSMYQYEDPEKQSSLIELFDIKGAMSEPIETYSHGMKKKIQLIAAFMLNSKLIILDEPFRGLDVEAIIMTKKLMRKYLQKGGSILLSTHDLKAAEYLAQRMVILSKGKIVAEGTIEELKVENQCTDMEDLFMKVSMLRDRSAQFEKIIENF